MAISRLAAASLSLILVTSCSEDASSPTGPSPTATQANSGPSTAPTTGTLATGTPAVQNPRSQTTLNGSSQPSTRTNSGETSDRAPGPVQNLRQLPDGGFVLAWDRPAIDPSPYAPPILRYRVERDGNLVYTPMPDHDCSPGEGCLYYDPDLGPGSYTFRVWAENPEPGEASSIRVNLAAVLPGLVRDLVGEQVGGDNKVLLTWKPPLAGNKLDLVVGYDAVTSGSDHTTVPLSACSGRGQALSCSSVQSRLEPGASHDFSVAAINSAGIGDRSYVQVYVNDSDSGGPETSDRAPGPVQELRQVPGPGVTLWWDRPAANQWTSQYPVIRYPIERDSVLLPTAIGSSDCSETKGCFCSDPDLAAGSYSFSVWAENPQAGPVSTITATVAPALPAEVRELAGEQVVGDNAVLLTWKAPIAGRKVDGSVLHYEVAANGSSYSSIVDAESCTGRRLNTSCSFLQRRLGYPGTASFRVRAVNAAGPGAAAYVDVSLGEPESPPFTASFENAPASHNGRSRFNLDLTFSEDFRVGFRRLKNQALDIQGGSVARVRRRVRGSNRAWQVRVNPSGTAAVTLTLHGNRACNTQGALCTPDGRRLATTVTVVVPGP